MNNPDKFEIEILADGSMKIQTDKVSGPNHVNAEQLLRECIKLAGGKASQKRKPGSKGHAHTHDGVSHTH